MLIALAQINTRVADFDANVAKILTYTETAKTLGADLVVFPELCVCGYPPRDLVDSGCFREQNRIAVEKIAASIGNIAVIVGAVHSFEVLDGLGRAQNAAFFLRNGVIELVQAKRLLPTYDVFDEGRNFVEGKVGKVITFKHTRIGISVCEDIWNNHKFWHDHNLRDPYRKDPVTDLVRAGAEIIVNISASPWHSAKLRTRIELLSDVAKEHEVDIVYTNLVGGNDHVIFDGNSMVVSREGQVVAQAKAFEEDIVWFDTKTGEGHFTNFAGGDDTADLYHALVLGTRDYVTKCGFANVVIGLSGGIDSALTAAIAVDALGSAHVNGITMPSKYSSKGSVDDAIELAKNLGIRIFKTEIQGIKELYQGALTLSENVFTGDKGISMTGVADENIQARIRGNILMTYSNQYGALVLSTGNKSELAVGYCTLYGDMAGGLAVLSDVPKTMVYKLAEWRNKLNPLKPCIPISTIIKMPSAELAPGQYDQQSLPPYEVLDRILEQFVEKGVCPTEIARVQEIDPLIVKKVVQMIERNEYKRQQATLGLKVTPKSFGYGRRIPIARKMSL